MGRLWCFLCLQVTKPPNYPIIKKKKKNTKVYRLAVWKRNCVVYSLRYDSRTSHGGHSMWKNFGLPCGTVKNKKGDQPLEKGILSGNREKKVGSHWYWGDSIIYLFMHEQLSMTNEIGGVLRLTWVIVIDLTTDKTNLSRLQLVQTWKKFE